LALLGRRPPQRVDDIVIPASEKPAQTLPSSLGPARPLPPSADIDPGGQSVGQAAELCLARVALPPHRLARRVLRLDPRLRRPAAIGRIRPLRHDALKTHAADVLDNV
jgi:hypothetical protein